MRGDAREAGGKRPEGDDICGVRAVVKVGITSL
ncbi:hypothetical protein ABIF68_006772 [Bradyrhizobium japonicum]